MEKRFTQGEWRKGAYSGVVGCPIMAQPDKAKNQFNICSVHGGETIDEVNANAKLISAAPDLLEALIKAQARINSLQTYFTASKFTDRYGDADANAECLLVIESAIKKAAS